MANRLFVQKIVSIGLVNKADNPESEVLIFKSRNTETGNLAVARKTVEKQDTQLAKIAKRLDELRAIPLIDQGATMTREQVFDQRDEWVTKNRGPDESEVQARARFWNENPEAKELSRSVGFSPRPDEPSPSAGELMTKAIDRRARDWHSQGLHFDRTLVDLRNRIRKAQPELVELERSTESLAAVKSRVVKSGDQDLRKALDFLSEWG